MLLTLQPVPENAVHAELTQRLDVLKYFDYLWKDCGTQEALVADRSGVVRAASNKALVGTDVSTKDFFRSAIELKVAEAGTGKITKGVRECLKGASGFDANGYLDYRGVNVLGFWRWMPELSRFLKITR